MQPSTERENDADLSRAPRIGIGLMIVILIGLALVAIYANVQKGRRVKIEQVIITPASTAAGQMEDTQPMPIPTGSTAPK